MPAPAPTPVSTVIAPTLEQPAAPAAAVRPRSAYLAILFGLCIFVFASPLVRLTLDAGLPPMAVAAGRPTLALAILSVILLRRPDALAALRQLNRRQLALSALGGVLLGLYFAMLSLALRATDVFVTQAIINTGPLWIALMEVSILREHSAAGRLDRPVHFSEWRSGESLRPASARWVARPACPRCPASASRC